MTAYPERISPGKLMARWGWLYAGLCALGLLLAALTLWQIWGEARLSLFGVTGQGNVTSLLAQSQPCGAGRSGIGLGCTLYEVGFDYPVAGTMRTARFYVSAPVFEALHVGGTVQLRYMADNPAVVAIDPAAALRGLGLLALLAAVMGILGLRGLQRRVVQVRSEGAA
jgi:hypothetical protein